MCISLSKHLSFQIQGVDQFNCLRMSMRSLMRRTLTLYRNAGTSLRPILVGHTQFDYPITSQAPDISLEVMRQLEQQTSEQDSILCDSLMRKRRRMMKKHKRRKWRKRMRGKTKTNAKIK